MNDQTSLVIFAIVAILIMASMIVYGHKGKLEKDEKKKHFDKLLEKSLSGSYSSLEEYDEKGNQFLESIPNALRKSYAPDIQKYRNNLEIRLLVHEHAHVLKRKLSLAIVQNDYGVITSDNTNLVYAEFIESMGYIVDSASMKQVELALDEFEVQQAKTGFDPETYPLDGHEFEHWVADNLKKFSWNAEVTRGSGDQGVDVIATKGAMRVGIQCKQFTSGKVGNSAVQEIVGAKALFGLTHLAVITTSDYTHAAKTLAGANSVALLSHYDIPRLDQVFPN